jgi:hypothetical protein
MFISKAEKDDLFHRINVLEQTVSFLENKLVQLSVSKTDTSTRKGREWSPAQRAIASANMKARHAKEKAQKEKV